MSTRPLLCWLLGLSLLAALAPAWAAGEVPGEEAPVDLTADNLEYDRTTDTWSARGEVRLHKGDLTLLADRVRYNPTSGEAEAIGAVQVTGPEGDLSGQSLLLNLETGAGRLVESHLLVREGNYHLAGEVIERFSEQRYRIFGGTLTTCDAEPPAWKFSARQLDVTIGGYARARHVFFYIHDIPVLYTPFLAYPVKTERESGFLMPRIGSSSKRGFQLSLAWYQVIDRHLDATFYLDYLSKLGLGKGLEYRYIYGQESEGVTHLYHITGLAEGEDRWAVDWQHAGPLPGEVRLTADVEYVSSRDYFEDFGVVAGEYNKDQAQSVLALSRLWPKYSLTGQVKYTKDLQEDNDTTLQKLPEAVFAALPQRLGETPFFLAMDASYAHFWRREGVRGQRLTARPELSAAFHPGDLLEIRSALGYRERLYWTSEEGPGYEQEGNYDFSTRVSARFHRVFQLERRTLKAIRHSLEPEVAWRYAPAEDQSRLPRFDALEAIEPANRLAYALVNRFTARLESPGGTPYYHDFAYLRLSQEYDIREARRDLPPGEPERTFTPLRLELFTRPTTWSSLDLDLQYDLNPEVADRLVSLNFRGSLQDGQGNGISLDYFATREELSYLTGTVDLAWLRPVYLSYLHRHDLDAGRPLEKVLNLEYRAQCWSLFLTVRDRLQETEYLVSFALAGLGRVADLGGRLRRPED